MLPDPMNPHSPLLYPVWTPAGIFETDAVAATAVAGARYIRLAAADAPRPPKLRPLRSRHRGIAARCAGCRRTSPSWTSRATTSLVARAVETHDDAGHRRQRGRHRGVLPDAIPFHPARSFSAITICSATWSRPRMRTASPFSRAWIQRRSRRYLQAHPEWFTQNAQGRPYRDRDLNIPCINGAYYTASTFPPSCAKSPGNTTGGASPTTSGAACRARTSASATIARKNSTTSAASTCRRQADWNASAYRAWIEWNYGLRLEIWDEFNRVTRAAGGPDCIWSGMNGGGISGAEFRRPARDLPARGNHHARQSAPRGRPRVSRPTASAAGSCMDCSVGTNSRRKAMAMYQYGATNYRLASKPEPEARLWAFAGFAAGIQPWCTISTLIRKTAGCMRRPFRWGMGAAERGVPFAPPAGGDGRPPLFAAQHRLFRPH